jgi:acyl-coenzyme A synthetase/AMP-(fatty) acid ligase
MSTGEDPVAAVFETSGTTGLPARWVRTQSQLRAEAVLVADLFGAIDRIVCFAPPEHLYGRLYGRVLPSLRKVPVIEAWHDPLAPLPALGSGRTLLVCLPATWHVLDHSRDRLRSADEVIVLHSTAPPPPIAHRLLAAPDSAHIRAVEVFGSTETGAVAHRELTADSTHDSPWQLLSDVSVDLDGETERLLTVSGPRQARAFGQRSAPKRWTMPDMVRPEGPGKFVRVGRASEIVKINGRRCHLPEVEALVRRVATVGDVAALAVPDHVRGEHYELWYSTDDPELGERELWTRLGAAVTPAVPAPRAIHRVRVIPRGPAGKVRRNDLVPAIHKR